MDKSKEVGPKIEGNPKDLATFFKKKGFIYPSSEIYGFFELPAI